ncbi:MAG: transglutaminase family protein [Isosphaeraceae bacterium]|nr:transglutaminase family protein [Isosphaeraceae bacterium]
MAIRVALNHKTTYRYDRLVQLSPQVVRLRPAAHTRTPISAYSIRVSPTTHFLNWQQDPQGNYQARLVFPEETREFSVEVDLIADLTVINPFEFFIEKSAERYPFSYDEATARELRPYLETEPAGPLLSALVEKHRKTDLRTIDHLVDINRDLQQSIRYLIRLEPGIQSCEETLELASGSCRDSSRLLVQLLRRLGLAARFVSGYLIQLKPDVVALDGPSGASTDFTDLHAWAEVYLPGAGWVGLDPTSGLLTGEGHIPLACTADPASAAPISGSFGWRPRPGVEDDRCEPTFDFSMSVTRIVEDPRVTKPYTEEQWTAIERLGHVVDERLRLGDVRLTMGGEPTFVALDDPDSPEWNTEALGPTKRVRAGRLLLRLRDRFAGGGALLHFGQGKWYPGEPLPRWALGCWWRRDGEAIWNDPTLVADESIHYGHDANIADRFIRGLADRLEVGHSGIEPAYEDVWYYLWRERRLPTNVDPLDNRLDDPIERARLTRIFDVGLDSVAGYALPIRPGIGEDEPRWVSGNWFLRSERLYLMPGDSPMGLRLPLDSLPWAEAGDVEPLVELDPSAPRRPLPSRWDRDRERQARRLDSRRTGEGRDRDRAAIPPLPGESASGIVRTALCVEPREGRLHVFMPPQRYLEDYLELVGLVEETARSLGTPVVIEGYAPPADPRLNHFSITPDPGVIEVNLHPTHSWDEMVGQTNTLYEEARLARLTTEKFMLDGRHTGTGGGNHIVLGGATPLDSPVLRRPDLLRSLVGYWNDHPSLSYLFSGAFVGPTSQAPRVDEARNDTLHELEIAFEQVPDRANVPPWLVDRIFRNLLVDATGNTHRTEFCIDKLYSPDSSAGRRGLVELRSFEMPPHSRMSLTQQLLIRALVAKFWEHPYDAALVRWGTELHDRFMLPSFVRSDFADVLSELRESGFPLVDEWFAPHFEFRFPKLGENTARGVRMTLRQAIEPWHVLGEEVTSAGTSRFVDSSVERVELEVEGMTDRRHVVACNGRRVPLHPTGERGRFVAGIRYRAWCPPSALHPTVGIHSPLTFELIDTWMDRSGGGFQYHVVHPGGRSFDTFPINAHEAESRRASRFIPFGHTPGRVIAPPEERNPESPFTLDLRKSPRSTIVER